MRHIPKAGLLQAMKQSLGDLDNLKLISPDDLEILNLHRTLREQIDVLQRQQYQPEPHNKKRSPDYETAA